MTDIDEIIHDSLKHYSDPYYDPVKAHQYYLENRILKGRKKAAPKLQGDLQKQGMAYAQNLINKEKAKVETKQRAKTTAQISGLQSKANAILQKIQAYANPHIPTQMPSNLSSSQQEAWVQTVAKQAKRQSSAARAERARVQNDLHKAVAQAKAELAKLTRQTNSAYKAKIQTEQQRIAQNVPIVKAPTKTKHSSRRKTAARGRKH